MGFPHSEIKIMKDHEETAGAPTPHTVHLDGSTKFIVIFLAKFTNPAGQNWKITISGTKQNLEHLCC